MRQKQYYDCPLKWHSHGHLTLSSVFENKCRCFGNCSLRHSTPYSVKSKQISSRSQTRDSHSSSSGRKDFGRARETFQIFECVFDVDAKQCGFRLRICKAGVPMGGVVVNQDDTFFASLVFGGGFIFCTGSWNTGNNPRILREEYRVAGKSRVLSVYQLHGIYS